MSIKKIKNFSDGYINLLFTDTQEKSTDTLGVGRFSNGIGIKTSDVCGVILDPADAIVVGGLLQKWGTEALCKGSEESEDQK